jgi:hypothetical protein
VRQVKEWTVDTWVLYQAEEDWSALTLLVLIAEHHCILFDQEGHIAREYESCLQRTGSLVLRNWLKRLRDRKAIIFRSGKLPPIHQGALLRMKFDRSDLPFVAVASRSKDKLLVSEDSDYTQKVCDYLQQQLQVKVLSLSQALEIARGTQDP